MSIDNNYNLPPVRLEYVTIVTTILRSIIQFAAGAGFIWASQVSDSQLLALATGVVTILTVVWSLYNKFVHIKDVNKAASNSAMITAQRTAETGTPTPIAVIPTPPGKPDKYIELNSDKEL